MLGEETLSHGGKGYSEGHADILGKVFRLGVGPRATYKLGWREKGSDTSVPGSGVSQGPGSGRRPMGGWVLGQVESCRP